MTRPQTKRLKTRLYKYLEKNGIASICVHKISEELMPTVESLITNREVDLIINIPRRERHVSEENVSDGFKIRRLAIDHHVPLITNLQIAEIMMQSLAKLHDKPVHVASWREYMELR